VDLTVESVERTWVDVPLRPLPARHMVREIPHWTLFEICRVRLACGVVGFGETMCYYTWGTVSDAAVASVRGKNAAERMWDDGLGAGLQMALFDAVARAADVPCHRLLGPQHRDRAFLSWWDIDMPAEDWLSECREALAQGYTSFKTKARPWQGRVKVAASAGAGWRGGRHWRRGGQCDMRSP
jgi:L-alanine-DL-glutamate epimerase-like enolase superfamily enzyme